CSNRPAWAAAWESAPLRPAWCTRSRGATDRPLWRAAPRRACSSSTLWLHLEDDLDLDRYVTRQASHADRRSGVPTVLAEDLHEQVRAAVYHLRLQAEAGRGVDHAEQLDDSADPVERAERGPHGREQLQPAVARRLV